MDAAPNQRCGTWPRMSFARFQIDVPPELTPTTSAVVDGAGTTLEGPGTRIIVDRSLFADQLTTYDDRPQFTSTSGEIGGQAADLVSFSTPGGTCVGNARAQHPDRHGARWARRRRGTCATRAAQHSTD